MTPLTVLSLFDGISCCQLALQRAGIPVKTYLASEIKNHAIKVTQEHFPKTIQLGDVRKISYENGILYYNDNKSLNVGAIDLLAGGSPCQDFSPLNVSFKHDYGLNGDKSSLFYEYLRFLREVQPKYFLLENVKMKKKAKEDLDKYLETEGVLINSSNFSYQNRPRFYWTNIKIPEIVDKNISFQDFKDTDINYQKQFKLKRTKYTEKMWANGNGNNSINGGCMNITYKDKILCVRTREYRCPNSGLIEFEDFCRLLTIRELEQAQTLPVGYTKNLSKNQAQDVIGDGWTVDVIAHIFKGLKEERMK